MSEVKTYLVEHEEGYYPFKVGMELTIGDVVTVDSGGKTKLQGKVKTIGEFDFQFTPEGVIYAALITIAPLLH